MGMIKAELRYLAEKASEGDCIASYVEFYSGRGVVHLMRGATSENLSWHFAPEPPKFYTSLKGFGADSFTEKDEGDECYSDTEILSGEKVKLIINSNINLVEESLLWE